MVLNVTCPALHVRKQSKIHGQKTILFVNQFRKVHTKRQLTCYPVRE